MCGQGTCGAGGKGSRISAVGEIVRAARICAFLRVSLKKDMYLIAAERWGRQLSLKPTAAVEGPVRKSERPGAHSPPNELQPLEKLVALPPGWLSRALVCTVTAPVWTEVCLPSLGTFSVDHFPELKFKTKSAGQEHSLEDSFRTPKARLEFTTPLRSSDLPTTHEGPLVINRRGCGFGDKGGCLILSNA
jgi:hypothetical protein